MPGCATDSRLTRTACWAPAAAPKPARIGRTLPPCSAVTSGPLALGRAGQRLLLQRARIPQRRPAPTLAQAHDGPDSLPPLIRPSGSSARSGTRLEAGPSQGNRTSSRPGVACTRGRSGKRRACGRKGLGVTLTPSLGAEGGSVQPPKDRLLQLAGPGSPPGSAQAALATRPARRLLPCGSPGRLAHRALPQPHGQHDRRSRLQPGSGGSRRHKAEPPCGCGGRWRAWAEPMDIPSLLLLPHGLLHRSLAGVWAWPISSGLFI